MKRYKRYGQSIQSVEGTYKSGLQFLDFLYDPDAGVISHTIRPGEEGRADLLAWKYLGDPSLYWIICEFNGIKDPLSELVLGTNLLIPTGTIDLLKNIRAFTYFGVA